MSGQEHQRADLLIEVPHKNDVLFGRGGGINSHPGNRNYRSIVQRYKHDYNLAGNKQLKADISNNVITQIHSLKPPGRFLAKSKKDSAFWEEVTAADAMKKTSQALREGAPDIRAKAVKQGTTVMNRYASSPSLVHTRNSRKRTATTGERDDESMQKRSKSDISITTEEMVAGNMVPVKAGNHAMTVAMEQAEKSLADHSLTQAALWAADAKIQSLLESKGRSVSIQSADAPPRQSIVDQMAETPPASPRIAAVESEDSIPTESLDNEKPLRLPTARTKVGLRRMHSLATSDVDPYEGFQEPFTNPFDVEGEQLKHTTEIPPLNSKLLRDISVTDVKQITFNRDQSNRSLPFSIGQLSDLNGLSERSASLRRLNSLALSDFDSNEHDTNELFQDPFRDEPPTFPGKKSLRRQGTDRSLTSELSDLPEFKDGDHFDSCGDINEGMKTIYDANNGGCFGDSFKNQRRSSTSRLFGPFNRSNSNIVEDSQ